MKKISLGLKRVQFVILMMILLNYQSLVGQAYVECATILNASPVNNLVFQSTKIVDGITYVAVGYDFDPTVSPSPPIINGTPFGSTTRRQDVYFAVYDDNCVQTLGTFIGGDGADRVRALELDDDGNIIITGETRSSNFPTTDGTATEGGRNYTFLLKYAPDFTLTYSTVFGASDDDTNPEQLLIDGTDVYVVGSTESSMIPTTDGTMTSTINRAQTYVTKYDANGNLVYATTFGDNEEEITAALLSNGNIVVTGIARSDSFPTTDGSTNQTGNDFFLTILDATGAITFSSLIGQGNSFYQRPEVTSDENDNIYLVGESLFGPIPTTDGTVSDNDFGDVFLRKYDITGNLIFATILEGGLTEEIEAIKVVDNEVYLLGTTYSIDLGNSAVRSVSLPYAGSQDGFLAKYDANGNLIYVTLYGGSGFDEVPRDFVVNENKEVYLFFYADESVPTTDGSSGPGFTPVKFNSDGSLCAATTFPFGRDAFTEGIEVIGDTMRVLGNITARTDNYSTDGTINTVTSISLWPATIVFCPDPTPVASDVLSPATVMVCQNGIVEQIFGEEIVIDGSSFPPVFINGVLSDQPDKTLVYQWQTSNSSSGPWTDIPGPVGKQQNYTPAPTVFDTFYRRVTSTSDCCGGTVVSISTTSSIIVDNNVSPTIDGGDAFYICPGESVMLSPSVTGGTEPYTYNWNDGEFTTVNPIVSPTESTVYTLVVSDANNCIQAGQSIVNLYTADAGEDKDVCEGMGVKIGGSALSGVTIVPVGNPMLGQTSVAYDWSPKNGSLSCTDCPNPLATPTTATDYTLEVTLYQPDGTACSTMDMVSVNVFNGPAGDLAAPDMVLCLGEMAELSTLLPPISSTTIAAVSQTDTDGGFTATIANLTDGDFTTGGKTTNGQSITIDLGGLETINTIQLGNLEAITGFAFNVEVSTDDVTYDRVVSFVNLSKLPDNGTLSVFNFNEVTTRYIRLMATGNFTSTAVSEFYASYDYKYSWTPGLFIETSGLSATFDAGNLEMPETNPITYTVNANIGTCNFYDQVTVAVIEARASEDGCGPRIIGEPDRTPNINETYSWRKITDPSITTGTGDFIDITNEEIVPVSASVGGNVGYELTVSHTLNGATGICRDTVIVPPVCGPGCDIVTEDDECPSFENGTARLIALPQNNSSSDEWTYSWTTSTGMVGLDNYDNQIVTLIDDITRTYTVTITSKIDPTYSCSVDIEVNSPAFSRPAFNATSPIASCGGDIINIGDPANNSGLTYAWSNGSSLNDSTIPFPEATVRTTTNFTVTVTDNVTRCRVVDTVEVITPRVAYAGEDLVVCDNGTVTIGSAGIPGYVYSWEPVGADWRNGTDENDAQPDAFVATTQDFYLTVVDPTGTCTTRDTINVLVEPLPPAFTLPDLDYCPTQTTPLVLGTNDGTTTGVNQVPDGYAYSWSPGLVDGVTTQNPMVNIPLPTSTVTYTVQIANPGGCNQQATQTINSLTSPPVVINDQTICLNDEIAIGDADNPTGAGISYSWSPTTDLDDPNSPNPTFISSAVGEFTYTLTKTENGCDNITEVTITVTEAMAPVLTPVTICSGEKIEIGTTNGGSLSYSWNPTTGLDNPFIENPTFSGTNTTNYRLTVIDINGCIAESATSVTVNPMPIHTTSVPEIKICDPIASSIVLNASIEPNGNYAYEWTPSTNLDNSSALNPTFFIPAEGDYEYILESTDQTTGCSIFDTATIEVVFNIPTIRGSAINPSTCGGNDGAIQLTLNNVPNGTYTVNYINEMGSPQTFTNVMIANGSAMINGLSEGVYNDLSITVDECTSVEDVDITIMDPETGTIMLMPSDESCALNDGIIEVIVTGGTAPFNIAWTDGGVNNSSVMNENSPFTINNLSAGTYNITVTDVNACEVSGMTTLIPPTGCCPEITDPNAPLPICAGEEIAFLSVNTDAMGVEMIEFVQFTTPQSGDAMYTGGTSLGIVMPSGGTATLSNVGFPTAGQFYIYGIISPIPTDITCRPNEEIIVQVNALPDVSLTVDDPRVCEEQEIEIEVMNSEIGVQYQLQDATDNSNVGSPTAGNGNTIVLGVPTALSEGNYTYNVVATNSSTNCIVTLIDQAEVMVDECDFPEEPPVSCQGFDPCHVISTDLYLGTQSTADTGSGTSDDNDGVIIPNDIQPGGTINLPITIFNNTTNDAYLTAWIDWNGDGDFEDAGEQIADETYIYASNNGSFVDYITVAIPLNAIQDVLTYAVFRLSTDDVAITSYCSDTSGCAIDGEVEVYSLTIKCKEDICVPTNIKINE